MANAIDKKCNCKIFSKKLKKDCFEKLVGPEIFALIGEDNTNVTINKPFSNMNITEITSVLESFDDICNYNKDFAQLRLEYLSSQGGLVNLERFRYYVKYMHSGYYYKKAFFFLFKNYINNNRIFINIFIRLSKKCLY